MKSKNILLNIIHKIVTYFSSDFQLELKERIRIFKEMDYDKSRIILNVESLVELHTRTHSCKKEPETIDWLEKNLRKGDIFFDIGANVGAYSLVASKFTHGEVKIYAFEPSYSTYAQLCSNIIVNNCQDSIIPLNIALSNKIIVDWFYYSSLKSGESCHAFGKCIDYLGESFIPICRQLTLSFTIDELVNYLEFPNLIKIDVDGIEFEILKGAEKTLSNQAVRSILIEVVEGSDEEKIITRLLNSKGFEIESKHKYTYGISPTSNYIFCRY